jgi:NAD(P)-dependent dehydrogenase (short-subunit alcohol dehydrogenase family)
MSVRGTAVDVDPDAWNKGMEINVTSMLLMAKYPIPAMLLRNRRTEGQSVRGQYYQCRVRGCAQRAGRRICCIRRARGRGEYDESDGGAVWGEGVRVKCVCTGE